MLTKVAEFLLLTRLKHFRLDWTTNLDDAEDVPSVQACEQWTAHGWTQKQLVWVAVNF